MSVFAKRTWAFGLVLLMSLSGVGSATENSRQVESLDVNPTESGVEFRIRTSEPLRYTYFELDGPRLVVDLHQSENLIGRQTTSVGVAGVRAVRVASFVSDDRDATRFVFDLDSEVPFELTETGDGDLSVRFGTLPAETLSPVAIPAEIDTEPVVEQVELTPEAVRQVEFEAVVDEALESATSADTVGLFATLAPIPVPAFLQEREPAVGPEAFARIGQTLAAEPAPQVDRAAAPIPSITVPAPLAAVPVVSALVPQETEAPETQYTGEIVSFNLVGSDMRDFFRVIAELSGLNIILDEGVAGQLNLVLNNVPWDQALDLVLRTNNLGYELQGNILRIAPQAVLQAEADARLALRDAAELNFPLETRPYILSYTTAAAVAGVVGDMLTERGDIVQDVRRNALIISDIPTRFDRIESMIAFLDTPSQQVEIEARLLSATKSFSRELGSQLGIVINNNGQNQFAGVPNTASPVVRTPAPTVNVNGALPLLADFPSAATSGFSFLLGAGGDILLDQIITVAEANGTAKLLSRPRVTTQNNQVATVSQGTRIPVQTNVNNTISVQFMPFNLSLTVTPQITDAGTILLTADIQNSTPDFGRAVGGVPSVSSQQATTQVLIPDGGTAVVGGILVDQDTVNTEQIPGLGDIPLIGNLFKSTSTVKSTSELLFFITARIKPSDPLQFLTGGLEDQSELFTGTPDEPSLQ